MVSAEKPIQKLLLITGCARSGTAYVTQVLNLCGLDVGHENIKRDGIVSWLMAVDDVETPYGPGSHNYQFKHIFHQVRDPLKTMSSLTTESPEAWEYVLRHIPEIHPDEPLIRKCAKYWYYWNKRAEEKAEWTYRVEDIESALKEIERRIGIPLNKELLHTVSKSTNHRDRLIEYSWADIKAVFSAKKYKALVHLARRYGYEVPD